VSVPVLFLWGDQKLATNQLQPQSMTENRVRNKPETSSPSLLFGFKPSADIDGLDSLKNDVNSYPSSKTLPRPQ
ncbi:MAG TPA: hypothetical protein VFP93_01615, partial [Gammaproteobacteria bacterium]|nr:hypothetical protein [Gammaproteobacteria bacterium]